MSESDTKKGPSPFDYSKTILTGRTPIPVTQEYSSYIVNRAVAHHRDCIYFCQLINEYQVTPEQHYTFLFNQVSKYKRSFERWVSAKKGAEDVSDIELVSKYYKCSIDVARQYLSFFTPETLCLLRSAYGGKESGKAATTS